MPFSGRKSSSDKKVYNSEKIFACCGPLKQSPEERYGRFGDGFKRAGALDTPAAALAGAAADKRQPAAGGGRRGPEAQPKGRRAPVPRQYCFAYARLPRVSASSIWHKRHKREQPHYTYDRLFYEKRTGPHPSGFCISANADIKQDISVSRT